jgi:hypothetical protein
MSMAQSRRNQFLGSRIAPAATFPSIAVQAEGTLAIAALENPPTYVQAASMPTTYPSAAGEAVEVACEAVYETDIGLRYTEVGF